jgi:hypothetical protein
MTDPRNDIAELIYTYGEMVDTGNFDGIGEMFAHAEITTEGFGEVRRGTSAVVAMYEATTRRYEDDGTPKTKHVMTNVIVQVDEDGDTATSRSYFTVLQAVPGALALQPIVAGRYRHHFERVQGVWRITGMHIIVDLVGDVSRHLLIDIGG